MLNALELLPADFTFEHYTAIVIAASVHGGNHEREIINFLKDHLTTLNQMPTAFFVHKSFTGWRPGREGEFRASY
jgi:menaquinone-dependent protoporphyrinogen IX oxidase